MLLGAILEYVKRPQMGADEAWNATREWFMSDAADPGTFVHACECIGVPISRARDRIMRLTLEDLEGLKVND